MKKYAIIILLFFFNSLISHGETINITQGNIDPTIFAINHFSYPKNNKSCQDIANMLYKIVQNNLKTSGLFHVIDNNNFIDKNIGYNTEPLFASWQQIGVQFLINGSIRTINNNLIEVNYTIWDINLKKKKSTGSLKCNIKSLRRLGHTISNNLYKVVTGYPGYFDDRVVFVDETGPYINRKKKIAIMDQDGHNLKYITDGKNIVFSPKFFPCGNKILYFEYQNKIPTLYILNLKTNKKYKVGKYKGISFSPNISKNGDKILLSITKNANTHIYEMDLNNFKLRQLTHGNSINVSPHYYENRIIFNSDQFRTRQIFAIDNNGKNMTRLSCRGGNYYEPAISHLGNILFMKNDGFGDFVIGTFNIKTPDSERYVANGYLVESPIWATDRMIVYSRENSNRRKNQTQNINKIYLVDYLTYHNILLPTPHDAIQPDWLHRGQ